MQKRFVVRDPAFRLMNESFARFVKQAVPEGTISQWERQVVGTPWSSARTAVITFAVAGAGFVVFTQQQIVSAWVGVLPALAPGLLVPVTKAAIDKLLAQGVYLAVSTNILHFGASCRPGVAASSHSGERPIHPCDVER
jgi:hypothetical protein